MRGAVLAGGAASRFEGRPKGLERIGGERILDRVVQVVQSTTGEAPLLIANAEEASTWRNDLQVVEDPIRECGSLGGIYTAVTAAEGPVLLVAWDMPFIPVTLLAALVKGAEAYDVFLPESGGRRGVEPLCGVYGPQCAPAIRERIHNEDYRAIGFHEAVRAGTLTRAEVEQHGDPGVMFFNVNTGDDLTKAEELWRQLG